MANVAGLKQALSREVAKLKRQEDAVEATKALIGVLEAQIETVEKKK